MRGDFGGSSVNDSFPSGFPRPLLSGSSECGSVSWRRSGLKVDDPGVTAFTPIIQVGAILAVIIYFRSDIRRLASLGSAASLMARPAKRPTTGSLGMSSSA